jgi:hypothetical protein
MNKHKLLLLSVALLCASLTTACWPFGGGGGQPQSGFSARGEKYVQIAGGGFFFVSLTGARGTWQFDNGNAVGNTTSFSSCCGTVPVNGGRVPARWLIFAGAPGECVGQITNPNMDVSANQTKVAQCLTFGAIFPFAMAPGAINLQTPPATFSMTGSGITTTYGMPRIEYIDQFTGNLIGATTATSVSGDGSSLQAMTPDLSAVYSGTYNMLVSNIKSDGSLDYIGSSTVDTYGRDGTYEDPPPPGDCGCPPDGGPCMVCGPVN